ncbi:pentapeptide repeat-containing protein [Gardnerella vaginalis]
MYASCSNADCSNADCSNADCSNADCSNADYYYTVFSNSGVSKYSAI